MQVFGLAMVYICQLLHQQQVLHQIRALVIVAIDSIIREIEYMVSLVVDMGLLQVYTDLVNWLGIFMIQDAAVIMILPFMMLRQTHL